MEIDVTSSAVRGFSAYARAAATERLEAAAAARDVRTSTRMGFRIGKFGVRYETEEGASSEETLGRARSAMGDSGGASLQDEAVRNADIPGLRQAAGVPLQLLSGMNGQDDLNGLAGQEAGAWTRKVGMAAYARADEAFRASQAQPMLRGAV
ncbi:hypothetical protein [Desulfovibrio psychrotolerans]|uniref:Uncharacterized protein n=1 Tax=Desulfovibrio psychrotolerans TaxID=415242 RepID=A0A7J0BS53_9BACT|nr:hypothetical protein [Desulfovibrio psychrotolerans]GFM35854.1 hypothetical protein DSM19430T_05380 [Desulfovibrio psychrotolerans]